MARIPYASAVGSLMYAMVCTRPDIAQAVGVLSRYMSNPGREHWNAIKRVFKYLRGTLNFSLCFKGTGNGNMFDIVGHVDADWGGDIDSRRSTSGYVFTLFGAALSWMSRRQSVVALSSTEAEYMALTHAGKEAVWLRRLCLELGFEQGAIEVRCDNQWAIYLAKNPAFHSRTKHIDIQYHFIREKVEKKEVRLVKVDTVENSSDFLTKAVTGAKFEWCSLRLD
ncbi:secreted RxLR effector protein 161-like [Syzygium oleosum]|uniref:secreted RxLR effector protein 161-like n=1 Tax=Syzygium oleosum TaxID=219896 RepID=UPI0024BA676E|nr:secreted RxLR effector protein 161-like [Syzygium oleosum]